MRIDLRAVFLAVLATCSSASCAPAHPSLYAKTQGAIACGQGTVTAWYTPLERDYAHDALVTIFVEHIAYRVPAEFMSEAMRMGTGRLQNGSAIGYWDGTFHRVSAPLSARGTPLTAGTLSVDETTIPLGSIVSIEWSPEKLQMYRAEDVTENKRLRNGFDVALYIGEGYGAKLEADRINRGSGTLYAICYYPAHWGQGRPRKILSLP